MMSAKSALHRELYQVTQHVDIESIGRLFDAYHLEMTRSRPRTSTTQDDQHLFGFLDCLDTIKTLLTTEHQDQAVLDASEDTEPI